MRLKHLSSAFLFLLAAACFAADTVGRVTEVKPLADGVQHRSEGAALRITALSPSVVRVRYSRSGEFKPSNSFAVVPDTGFIPPAVHVLDQPDSVVVDTGAFDVRIQKDSTRVVFAEHSGKSCALTEVLSEIVSAD